MKRMHITAEMADGRILKADSTSADYMRYEQTAKRHKWGSMQDNPAIWEIFVGWCALVRTGQYGGTWEQFTAPGGAESAVNVDGELFDLDPTP